MTDSLEECQTKSLENINTLLSAIFNSVPLINFENHGEAIYARVSSVSCSSRLSAV